MSDLKWYQKLSLNQKDIYYRMILAFGLFFLSPLLGFAYFAHQYNLLQVYRNFLLFYIIL